MTSPPDKLFRDRLEHYSKPAPASAWSRIESGMDRKRNRLPWMKIAAGLFLLLGTSFMIWQLAKGKEQGAGSNEPLIANSRQPEAGSLQSTVDSIKSLEKISTVDRSRNNHHAVVQENLPVVERSRKEPSESSNKSSAVRRESSDSRQEVVYVTEETPSTSFFDDEKITEPSPATENVLKEDISTGEIVQAPKGINMTYSAEEVNEKYLKQGQTPDATPEKKNTSGLQKVIDRALDLKYEESVLADLREKKNEWLSLNIPSKQRETNK